MDTIPLHIRPIHPKLGHEWPVPHLATAESAGFDVAAAIDVPQDIAPGTFCLIACGFAMALPEGYEAQVRPRSGLAAKHGITVLNSPGTIDADYRGEVRVLLINLGPEPFVVTPGMRIAQLVVAKLPAIRVEVVQHLPDSGRGAGGFGSTGS